MPLAADKNYFELFGLPAAFDLDVENLAARYRDLARATPPDRYASGSDFERRLAMQMTTLLNEAHRVLKDPICRAGYLLQLKGVTWPEGTAVTMPPAFLM